MRDRIAGKCTAAGLHQIPDDCYTVCVVRRGGDNFTRYKITEEIAKGNIKIIPDILIGGGTGTDGGINGLLGMKLMEMMDTKKNDKPETN